jgi:hypothetical protein
MQRAQTRPGTETRQLDKPPMEITTPTQKDKQQWQNTKNKTPNYTTTIGT